MCLDLTRQAWWYTPVILAFRQLKQEDFKFEMSLGSCLKKVNDNNNGKTPNLDLACNTHSIHLH
jgi:hypothetical protein